MYYCCGCVKACRVELLLTCTTTTTVLLLHMLWGHRVYRLGCTRFKYMFICTPAPTYVEICFLDVTCDKLRDFVFYFHAAVQVQSNRAFACLGFN